MSDQLASRFWQPKLFLIENPLASRFGLDFFRSLPSSPGVYFFYGNSGEILYVGQSSDLKTRISSYRHVTPEQNPSRTLRLVHRIARIEWQECVTASEAIERERALLLEHRPRFNRAGVWQPAPWWLEIGADAAVSRLQLHLKREEGGIGPLPSAFRHVYASLVRWIYRCALPSGRMAEFPHGVFQPRIPLLHSVAMPIAESIANEIKEYIRSQSPAFIRRLEALPPARPGSEQEYWSEELDRLRKWATQTSGFEPNAVRHDASP